MHRLGVTLLALALALSSCGSDSASDDASSELSVVATTTILGDIVDNIVGDGATVEVLLPVGASPHDYQASSEQVAHLQTAGLVVANGLHLEEGLEDVLESAIEDGANVFEVGALLDPLPFSTGSDHDSADSGHEHEEGSLDPHVWLDPVWMADAAKLIAAELEKVDPSTDWTARADEYATELLETNSEIAETLSSIPEDRRVLVTNHASLGYFADRYDFEVIGVVFPGGSALAEPSSAELSDLVEVIDHEGVSAIFGETTESTEIAEAVAAEIGTAVEVVQLYTGSLGEPGSGAETLIDMLLLNARKIAEALS